MVLIRLFLAIVALLSVFPSHATCRKSVYSEDRIVADYLAWLNERGYQRPTAVEVVVESASAHAGEAEQSRRDIFLVAARAISAGEVVLSIPPSLFLTSHVTAADVMPFDVKQVLSSHPDIRAAATIEYVILACWLLRHQAAADAAENASVDEAALSDSEEAQGTGPSPSPSPLSPWSPYIRILPTFIHSPVVFPDHLLSSFEAPDLTEAVEHFRSLLSQLYRLCSPSSLSGASLSSFTWAMLITMSRTFSLTQMFEAAGQDGSAVTESGEVPSAFLPFADLFNHAADPNLVTKVSVDGSLQFIAVRAIQQGSPLCFSYGLKPNYELLTSYGFILEDNPHDSLVVAGSADQLVSLFLRHQTTGSSSSSGSSRWQERSRLQRVALRAMQEVMRAKEQLEASEEWGEMQASSPQVHISTQSPMAVFASGAVDARALAALTAMWHVVRRQREPNYNTLAMASTWFGWSTDETTCKDVGESVDMTEYEQESMKAAVETLMRELDHLKSSFSTTIEEDEAELMRIKECRMSKEMDDSLKCPHGLQQWGQGMEMAILFRVSRKKLIEGVYSRLREDCFNKDDKPGEEMNDDMHSFSLRYSGLDKDEL